MAASCCNRLRWTQSLGTRCVQRLTSLELASSRAGMGQVAPSQHARTHAHTHTRHLHSHCCLATPNAADANLSATGEDILNVLREVDCIFATVLHSYVVTHNNFVPCYLLHAHTRLCLPQHKSSHFDARCPCPHGVVPAHCRVCAQRVPEAVALGSNSSMMPLMVSVDDDEDYGFNRLATLRYETVFPNVAGKGQHAVVGETA